MAIEIFEIDGFVVRPTKEALLIPEYKAIWDRDITPKKLRAMFEFAYVYFMINMSKKNLFRGYNEEQKSKEIIKRLLPYKRNYEPDELVLNLLEAYKEDVKSSSLAHGYLMDAKIAAETMRSFFRDPNTLTKTNARTGAPIYKPKDITSALIDTQKVIENLEALERKLQNEELTGAKNKSNRDINPLEE